MEYVKQIVLGNTLDKWLTAGIIATILWIFIFILKKVVHHRIHAFAQKAKNEYDDLLALLVKKINLGYAAIVALSAGAIVLKLPKTAGTIVGKAAVLALLLQTSVWGTEAISFWLDRRRDKRADDKTGASMIAVLRFLLRAALWTIILLVALDNLGVHITTLVAGLGIGGVAMALAIQNILGDLFSSLSIILDKPFVVGDFISVDDYQGNVEHIGMKTTRIRSLSGEQLVFANSDLLKSRIRNYENMTERRIQFKIRLVRQTPREQLSAIPDMIRSIIETLPWARFERAHFKELGDSSFDFEIVYWVLGREYGLYMDIQHEINLGLVKKFGEEGIEFAYPTRTVFTSPDAPAPGTPSLTPRRESDIKAGRGPIAQR
jgi:small-conductance mechanosensitive channel